MKTKYCMIVMAMMLLTSSADIIYGQESADNAVSAEPTPTPKPAPVPQSIPSISTSLASTPPPSGKPVRHLSLKDALQRAVSDNPLVRIERINTDIALSFVRDNHGQLVFDPRVKLAYTGSRRESRPFSESHDLSLSVANDLRSTGTGIEAGIGASPAPSSLSRPSADKFQNGIGITVTQSLLQGGLLGISANLVPLRKARIDADIRREELAAYAQKVISDVERAYWDLLFSGEQMNIYRYSLELAQRLLYESEERLRIGSAAPIDLVAIRAEVASRERQLYDAEVAYRQKSLYLIYIMNASDLWDASLALTDTVAALGKADAVSEHIDAAHMFRPDYRMAFMLAQKGELDLVQAQNGLLPRLDFFVSLQGITPAETFPGAFAPGGGMSGVVSGGFVFQYPIRNTAARERRRRTEYSAEQQKLSIENYARLVEYEIRSAHIEVERALRQVETAKTVSALQLQKLEAEQQKMDAGKSTGYAVLQVQRDLVSASLDEALARTAYVGALVSLFSKDGTLLQRRGIKTS